MGYREASYLKLHRTGELSARVEKLYSLFAPCRLCPRECRVDRRVIPGTCGAGNELMVASITAHHGEEPPISGKYGSGAVFLSCCSLSCVYCQNHEISQPTSPDKNVNRTTHWLAEAMIRLQDQSCHNINWVSPTHQVPLLVDALNEAADMGLQIPIVYNTHGYERVEVLKLLDGIIDIYLPDLKYSSEKSALALSDAAHYPRYARQALKEMYSQTGDKWDTGSDGTLLRGMLVRLLVLPDNASGTGDSLRWIARTLSPLLRVSLMSQYFPCHRVSSIQKHAHIARKINRDEWLDVIRVHREIMPDGEGYIQHSFHSADYYRPDFSDRVNPFPDSKDFFP